MDSPGEPLDSAVKRREFKYGRDEMLALYGPSLPVPDDLRDMSIFCVRNLLPLAFLPTTEDEQMAFSQSVNSALALRSMQGAISLSHGGRMNCDSSRGRGKGRSRGDAMRRTRSSDEGSELTGSMSSVDWRTERVVGKEEQAEKEGAYGNDCRGRFTKAPTKSLGKRTSNLHTNMEESSALYETAESFSSLTTGSQNKKKVEQDGAEAVGKTELSSDKFRCNNPVKQCDVVGDCSSTRFLSPHDNIEKVYHDAINDVNGIEPDNKALHSIGSPMNCISNTDDVGISNCIDTKDLGSKTDVLHTQSLDAISISGPWFYKDPNGKIQGPFSHKEMESWFSLGYFTMKLLVRQGWVGNFIQLGDLIKAYGHVPFLSQSDDFDCQNNKESAEAVLSNQINGYDQQLQQHVPGFQNVDQLQLWHCPSSLSVASVLAPSLSLQNLVSGLDSAFRTIDASCDYYIPPSNLMNLLQESDTASVKSNLTNSGLLLNSDKSLNSKSETSVQETLERKLVEKIEKDLKDKMALELEKEKLYLEQMKLEEEKRLLLEHQQMLEEERNRWLEKQKMDKERRLLEEERLKLEELHRKAEESRLQEQLRLERKRDEAILAEKTKIEEERRYLEAERSKLEAFQQKMNEERRIFEQLQQEKMSEQIANMVLDDLTNDCCVEMTKTLPDMKGLCGESVTTQNNLKTQRSWGCDGGESMNKTNDVGKHLLSTLSLSMQKDKEEKQSLCTKESTAAESSKPVHDTHVKLVPWTSSTTKTESEEKSGQKVPTAICPWGATSTVSARATGLAHTVDAEKRNEISKDAKMQKGGFDSVQQSKQKQQCPWQTNGTQNQGPKASKIPSLLEIQEEQARQEEAKKEAEKRLKQEQAKAYIWKEMAKVWGNESGDSSTGRNLNRISCGPSGSAFASSATHVIPTMVLVSPTPTSSVAPLWKQKELHMKSKAQFIKWCEESLKSFNTSVDIPTLIEFLKDVDSPYELHDYIRLYLGESKQAKDFARQFFEKRKSLYSTVEERQ